MLKTFSKMSMQGSSVPLCGSDGESAVNEVRRWITTTTFDGRTVDKS